MEKELSVIEHLRKRPGMYVGSLDNKGVFVALLDLMQFTILDTDSKRIQIEHKGDLAFDILLNDIIVTFNGALISDKSKIHNSNIFNLSIFSAICNNYTIDISNENDESVFFQKFIKGVCQSDPVEGDVLNCYQCRIQFDLDREIWGNEMRIDLNYLSYKIQEFAFLKSEVSFNFMYNIGERSNNSLFYYPNGLKQKLDIATLISTGGSIFNSHVKHEFENFNIEIAFAFREYSVDEPIIQSYANEEYTPEDGAHVDGVIRGLTFGIMKYFQKEKLTNKYKISEKGLRDAIVLFVHLQYDDVVYTGCVKHKVGNSEIIKPISDYLAQVFFEDIENDVPGTEKLIRIFEM